MANPEVIVRHKINSIAVINTILETAKKCRGLSGFGATGQKIISVHGGEKSTQFYHNCVEGLPE